jgi:hypothetical protein
MFNKPLEIEIEGHVLRRMEDRGGNLKETIEYLRKGSVVLTKNSQGYEISIPFKGRLAGDFDRGVFIIKTFLSPFRFGKDYYPTCEKTRTQYNVRVASIRLPRHYE